MSDIPGPSALAIMDENSNKENMDIFYEPEKKKVKVEEKEKEKKCPRKSPFRILCVCAVCLDLPKTCYQCTNGHLMCWLYQSRTGLIQDSKMRQQPVPTADVKSAKNLCSRNLAVEKAVSELPTECQYCYCHLPRNQVDYHERIVCERPSLCKYSALVAAGVDYFTNWLNMRLAVDIS
ncbi:unnamed protein product [Mytilus edulis]|uniref:Uncharacterized protein n=1 Tax=Mytilus edulis TaxID=6550 RepID=A0A8S3UQC9_MYTED|nr:unnamed protein product [Mytilus edulis]